MDRDKIYDRINKLLRLTKSDNEAEATLAAQRAAELMQQYAITEAEISLTEDGGHSRTPERILEDFEPDRAADGHVQKNRIAWRGTIAHGVAYIFGCRQYWRGPSIRLFGRESAVQSAAYTCRYLWNEVERLADAGWLEHRIESVARAAEDYDPYPSLKSTAHSWKHAFRLGCAIRIAERLRLAHDEERRGRMAKVTSTISVSPTVSGAKDSIGTRALAIVNMLERDEQEVNSRYADFSRRFGRARTTRVTNRSGYAAGRAAGNTVAIGRRTAGLPAPPRQIPR